MSKQVEALLIERKGYEMRGLQDRVSQVDEQLRLLGYSAKYLSAPKEDQIETATSPHEVETATVRRGRKPKAENADN